MIEDLLRSVLGLPPGVNKINKDLVFMRQMTLPIAERIIPWEEEKELELMSLNLDYKTQKRGLDKIIVGTIQSIYFEPMVAFAYKDYVKGSREALLYCRTSQKELVFRIKKRVVDVYLNGGQVAVINLQSEMFGLKSKLSLGEVKRYSGDLLSVIVKGKEAGHLFNPRSPHSSVQRAFYLMKKLDAEEQGIFLALGLYELLTRIIVKKKKK